MVTPEIIDYIKKKRQEGMNDDAIRQDLTKGMWSEEDIHIAFTSIDKGTPIPTAPAQSQVDTRTIVVILALVLCYPVGLIFMWWWMKRWSLWIKILITSIWAIFFLLYIGIFALNFYVVTHNPTKKNSYHATPQEYQTQPNTNNTNTNMPMINGSGNTQYNQPTELPSTTSPTPTSAPGVNITTAPTGTTHANGTCVADNGCKFRSPGSGYRCDANGNFTADGTKYCTCNKDCSVTIQ